VPAAALTAAAVVGSSLIGAHSTSKAVDAQQQSAADANALQKYMYDQSRSDQAPWREIGGGAIDALKAFTTPGADLTPWLKAQPGYQAGLDTGRNTVERSAAAGGSLNSGGTVKALDRFGQDYAAGGLNNAFNRLATLAGFGQVANQQGMQAGQNYANQGGQNMLAGGNAAANGYLANGQTFGNAFSNIAGIGANYFANRNPYAGSTPLSGGYAQTVPTYTPANVQTNVPDLVTSSSLPGF
jgi:hypothetical protein